MKTLVVIPAHDEREALPGVLRELRASLPDADVLVVDDASTDGTSALLAETPGVRWLRFAFQLGVGGAVRAGLRFARQKGYERVVRLDADGQHPAAEAVKLLEALEAGADTVQGSRFLRPAAPAYQAPPMRRMGQRFLSLLLSVLTRRPVSDPTSGFWAFGGRAVRLLSEHHPTGYAEPELHLLLTRMGLSVREVPVEMRARQGGRTSLTTFPMAGALARSLLAMVVVPLRARVKEDGRD